MNEAALTFTWWHLSNALVRMASILPLSVYPHMVARFGLPPHCTDLADYRETRHYFRGADQ